MNKKVIPICLYVDHDCLLHAMVCFLSIKDHNPSAHICLVYKEDFPLSKEEIAWFEENKPVWGEVEFVCFPLNAEPLLDIAGKLEKYQQILWINSKSIVQTELTPLLSLNMGESIFAACAKNMSQKERNYATVCLNLQEGLYFNLNICIINVGSYMKADAGSVWPFLHRIRCFLECAGSKRYFRPAVGLVSTGHSGKNRYSRQPFDC